MTTFTEAAHFYTMQSVILQSFTYKHGQERMQGQVRDTHYSTKCTMTLCGHL
uniref:Uncharacterized protein n=1 Tax=Anguilla anguilla TaxID=7936 RepID=A0A0E9WAA5_ANGAN